MAGMCDCHDLVAKQPIRRDARIFHRERNKRNIQIAMHYPLHKRLARSGTYAQLRIRVFFFYALQYMRKLKRGKFRRRRTDPQTPVLDTAKLGDLGQCRIVFPQDFPRPFQQIFACLGQYHASGRPRKKLQTDFILKLPDLHRDRRLRDIDALSPGRKSLGLGNRKKCLELFDLHRVYMLLVNFSRTIFSASEMSKFDCS